MKVNQVLHLLGFGKFQVYISLLAAVLQIFGGLQINSSQFLMPHFGPKMLQKAPSRCFVEGCDDDSSKYFESWVHNAVPKDEDSEDGALFSKCHFYRKLPGGNGTCLERSSFSNNLTSCSKWVYSEENFLSTVASDFNLVCKSKGSSATSEAVFMAGVLTGSVVFGYVSDRWGRKSVFLAAPLLLSSSSIGTAFANKFPLFTFLRFLTAVGVSGLFQTGYVLAVEFMGKSKRLWCANSLQMVFAGGELILAGIASVVRQWKNLQLIISVPTVLLIGYNWLLPESARWQISKKQFDKARSTLVNAANWNKVTLPENLLRSPSEQGFQASPSSRSNPLDLVRTSKMRKWTINLFVNWIVNALVYYGLSLSAGKLSGNIYLNFAALSFVEIPAVFLATLALKRCGRRPVLCSIMVFGGIACISTVFVPTELGKLATALAVLGKSAIAASFAIIYIYSAEIYPTVLRNTGIGISSMFARIGGIIAPFIAGMRKVHLSVPMIIFGVSSIIAGFLALALPETCNKELPETVEEAEGLGGSGDEEDGERMRLLSVQRTPSC